MSQATLVRDEGNGIRWYRCKNCGEVFKVERGRGWGNCFYCSQGCAASFNACPGCGNNKHFSCTCGDEL
jgi:hypothetical protein